MPIYSRCLSHHTATAAPANPPGIWFRYTGKRGDTLKTSRREPEDIQYWENEFRADLVAWSIVLPPTIPLQFQVLWDCGQIWRSWQLGREDVVRILAFFLAAID